MKITYDSRKNLRNIQARGLDFNLALQLDWQTAIVTLDHRKDYNETRYIASAKLAGRLHILVFSETLNGIRVISFRKANKREQLNYEQARATTPN